MSSQTGIESRPRYAIAGATGRVGSALISNLLNDPVDLLALSRSSNAGGVPPSVPLATVNFENPTSLLDALRGTDKLFLAHGTSAQQVANEIALIDAAVAAGVAHIVKLSVMGPASKLHPFDWHMEIEAHLARQDIGYGALQTFIGESAGIGIAAFRPALLDEQETPIGSRFSIQFHDCMRGCARSCKRIEYDTGGRAPNLNDLFDKFHRFNSFKPMTRTDDRSKFVNANLAMAGMLMIPRRRADV